MLVFDFFSGTGSATQAFEDAGHKVIKVELDEYFEADERDILQLSAEYLLNKYGRPDFVWASPPCTSFSVASIGRYWNKDLTPRRDAAELGLRLVDHTRALIEQLQPAYGWIIENPRGMLRKLRLLDVPRRTVTYCQYGDTRMKPTDLWGYVPNWTPKPACKNGDNCHEAAPRGSRTGTQGLRGAKMRSTIPYDLGHSICEAVSNHA
jgi:site-specific DNA-cytosine methylase